MLHNSLVVIPFNAKLEDGCDYALQTIRVLSQFNTVVAVLLGDPYSWGEVVRDLSSSRGWQGITHPAKNTWYVRPLMIVPGQRWLPIKKLNVWLTARWLALALRLKVFAGSQYRSRVLWFFEPFFVPPFLTAFSDYESIYDCVDRYRPLGFEAQQAEAVIKEKVDHMTVISKRLMTEHSRDRAGIVKVPLGFDEATFTKAEQKFHFKPTQLKGKKSLVIGFCGGINYRFDFPVLFRLIRQHSQHTFWFIGPLQLTLIPGDTTTAQLVKKLLALPNVKWTPPVPKARIPKYIAQMDVCLIPYDLQFEFNRYCHPMKGAEYLFLGKPILATRIVELSQPLYRGLVLLGSTAAEFAEHLRHLQQTGWPATMRRRQRQAAQSQNWERKVEAVSQVLTTAASG